MLNRSKALSLLAVVALLVFVAMLSQPEILGPAPTPLWACGGRSTTAPNGAVKCVGLPTTYYCWKTGSPAPHLVDHPPNDRQCTDAEMAATGFDRIINSTGGGP